MADHLFGNARPEGMPCAAVVLVAEHDEIHPQLLGALQDDLGDVVFRRIHELAMACVPQLR
jgi:hypothetical protein